MSTSLQVLSQMRDLSTLSTLNQRRGGTKPGSEVLVIPEFERPEPVDCHAMLLPNVLEGRTVPKPVLFILPVVSTVGAVAASNAERGFPGCWPSFPLKNRLRCSSLFPAEKGNGVGLISGGPEKPGCCTSVGQEFSADGPVCDSMRRVLGLTQPARPCFERSMARSSGCPGFHPLPLPTRHGSSGCQPRAKIVLIRLPTGPLTL